MRPGTTKAILELASAYLVIYNGLPVHERQHLRMWALALLRQLASELAVVCGRVSLWAERQYYSETATI